MQTPNFRLRTNRRETDYAGFEQPGGARRFSAVLSRCRRYSASLVLLLGFFGTRARWAGSPRDISVAREVRLRSQSILAPQGSHYGARGSRPAAPARAGDSASMYRARARYSLSRLFRRADVAGSRARCIRPGSHPRDGTACRPDRNLPPRGLGGATFVV